MRDRFEATKQKNATADWKMLIQLMSGPLDGSPENLNKFKFNDSGRESPQAHKRLRPNESDSLNSCLLLRRASGGVLEGVLEHARSCVSTERTDFS